jgi:hypothetical protein
MITPRKSDDRGLTELDWLQSRHSFSFGDYHDPAHMGFRTLRVINEDHVAPAKGFGFHPHRDMEILTWVLAGELEHKDSLGNGSVIRPGDAQRMSAGSGIVHSETNPSPDATVHLLQIWILPERRGIAPGYEQKRIPDDARRGRLALIASPDGADGSLVLHTDARVYDGVLERGDEVALALPGRAGWLQVARGAVRLAGGEELVAGDAAAVQGELELRLVATEPAEVLAFDLP